MVKRAARVRFEIEFAIPSKFNEYFQFSMPIHRKSMSLKLFKTESVIFARSRAV